MSAEAAKTEKPAEKPAGKKEKPPKKKEGLPANCMNCNKRIRRKSWYYQNGKYFCCKGCAKIALGKAQEEKAKAQEEKAKAAAEPKEDGAAPAEEAAKAG